MRIAKPLLLVSTPVGVIWGVVVAWQMKPWLGILMAILLCVISVLVGYTVHVIRREHRQSQSAKQASSVPEHHE